MLPGAPDKDQVLLRCGAWADEEHVDDRADHWGPALFPTRRAAAWMIRQMRRNRGYLPDRFRWMPS